MGTPVNTLGCLFLEIFEMDLRQKMNCKLSQNSGQW